MIVRFNFCLNVQVKKSDNGLLNHALTRDSVRYYRLKDGCPIRSQIIFLADDFD